ncbi:MAG TPA: tetratricopeptide repeat protein [Mucilaginibacter sp.]
MKFNCQIRLVYLVIGIILPLFSFANNTENALFAKANIYYGKAQYKDALSIYQQILDSGYQSAAVYFDMGNASYKNGDIPSALLYYEKAHKLVPGDDDINYNIRFANSKTTDKIDQVPEFFLANWWRTFILSFSRNALSIASIILVLCASIILMVYFFTGSVIIKKASFYTSTALFFLGIVTVFIALMQINYFDGHRQAIIFSNSVTVKSGPVDKSSSLFVIHDGTKVNVLENSNGWMKISLVNGNVGWIKMADAKEI